MKYKVIKSMAHNFTHSFVSYSNYVNDGHFIVDLRNLARQANGRRIRIQWVPGNELPASFPIRLQHSIKNYRKWLPQHLENHEVDEKAILEFRTDIFLLPNRQIVVEAYVLDDREKEHIHKVQF